jgi:translocation and assembly module TamA
LTAIALALAAPVLALALIAPAAAQELDAEPDRTTDPELEALIPDSAIDDPEAFARGTPDEAVGIDLDPSAPLAETAGITLPWPDETFSLPALAELEPEADIQAALAEVENLNPAVPDGDVSEISPRLALAFPADPAAFPIRDEFEDRFEQLSSIETLGDDDDTIAQVAARANSDRELLVRLLRIYGYYDPQVYQTVGGIEPGKPEPKQGEVNVRFDVVPGPRYQFGTIALGDLETTGPDYQPLRSSFEILPGEPVLSDKIVEERDDLDIALGESGYAFAKVGEPDLLIDHRREQGDLTVPVTHGGKYTFGEVTSSLPRFLSGDHFETIARFEPGDLYKRSLSEDLRRAILATGLVSSVIVKPREVTPPSLGMPGTVALDVEISKAPVRTFAGQLGYDSADGFRAEASWEHRNLFPPEGALRVRGVLGTREQLVGATFRRNNFKGRDQVLTLDAFASTIDRRSFEARTVSVSGSFEKLTTLLFQKPWTWAAGFEAVATEEREPPVNGVAGPKRTYFIGALPLRAAFDASDDLLDPTRGFRVGVRLSPEVSHTNGERSAYARLQADASYYQPVTDRVVMAARTRVASIPGTELANIAPSRRLYAGGGGSVRGYGYQQIGPRNSLGDPSGGRSLVEFSLEARVNTGFFNGALQVVPFVDAGSVDQSVTPTLDDIRFGAGIGVRYKTGFGPIRVDIATPLNRREGDSWIGVYVGLGQAF